MAEEKETEIKVIKGGRLIDGTGAEPTEDATVIIEGSKIKAVGKGMEIPKGARVIDATGKTVMPGLIDSHLHHFGLKTDALRVEGLVRPRELSLIKSIDDSKALFAAGFTTVKDCGTMNAILLRKAVAEGSLTGLPRIVASGYSLKQTGGHGEPEFFPPECVDARTSKHQGFLTSFFLFCDGVDECIKATRYALRQGADFIKVTTSGGMRDEPFNVNFNLDEVKAIVETAAQAGKFVTAHCQNSRAAKNSIVGGIKTIDHANEINDEVVRLAKRNGTIFVSTLAIFRRTIDHAVEGGMEPAQVEKAKMQWGMILESYKRIHKAGAILAAGTDSLGSPLMPFGKNAIELELLVKHCEFTPMDAIVAATKNGALACFMGDKTGTIEPGKFADIIVVDGNPLADIKILQNVEKMKIVMLEGRVEIDHLSGR